MNVVDLTPIKQGASFSIKLTTSNLTDGQLTTPNLTGASARLQFRFSYTDPVPVLSLTSSPPSGITISASDPSITVSITSVQTLDIPPGFGFYDLLVTTAAGAVLPMCEGRFFVFATATR